MNETGNIESISAVPVPTNRVELDGYVYFASDGEAIKIGWSGAPATRVDDLRTSSPREIRLIAQFKATMDEEQRLHSHFNHLHIRGEWFASHKEILDFIALLKKGECSITEAMTATKRADKPHRVVVPADRAKFKDWADKECVRWPVPLMSMAAEAYHATTHRPNPEPFEKFRAAYDEWLATQS